MNKDLRIKVRTPVGDSKEEEVGKTVTQGSLESAIVSTNSISKGVEDFFNDSEHKVWYGNIHLQPFQFLDDLGRFSYDPVQAQYGNVKIENLLETKLLDCNLSKTSIILLGNKKERENWNMNSKKIIPHFTEKRSKL